MKQIQDENRGMSTLIEKIKVKRTKLSRILATVCRILFAPSLYIFYSFFTAAAVHLQDSAPFLRVRFSGNCAAQLQRILALGILNFLISFSPLTWPGQLPRRGHTGRRSRDLTTFQIKTHLMRNKRENNDVSFSK